VPDCLSQYLDDAAACTTPRAGAVDAGGVRAERAAVERAGGSYLDVSPWVCSRSTCAVVVGNLLTYRDDNHLSTAYAAWLAPLLAFQLDESIHAGHRDATAVLGHGRAPKPLAGKTSGWDPSLHESAYLRNWSVIYC
jgi:hypothetical protein